MTTTTSDRRDPALVATFEHRDAAALAETAYGKFADVVATLRDEDWAKPTDCEGWTVRDLVGHVVGSMRAAASVRELLRQQREIVRRQKRDGGAQVDIMTALQIELTSALTNEQLAAECRALVSKAAAGRRRVPGLIRRYGVLGVEMPWGEERWTYGYLLDTILTRDTWLHRIDLCRAINTEPALTADHDGRIVADVVAEWAIRHGKAYELRLTGPLGHEFKSGTDAAREVIEIDAVEFCRIVSGRGTGEGLLAVAVPF